MRRHIHGLCVRSRTLTTRTGRSLAALAVMGAAALAGAGCGSGQLAGKSPAYLMIDKLEATQGLTSQTFGGVLESDVLTKGGVLEDAGRVTFSLGLKDPGAVASPSVPSSTNFITVNRYHVDFVRSDGRATPGVDVPYSFDGAFTATVSGPVTVPFVLVRVQAKLEAPLMGLRNLSSAIVISTIARVTFYGQDQAGNPVSVTGQISVNFADWADPAS